MVLALACASQFMVILDASIVNVALPSIQRDLGFTDPGLAWVVNGYLLTFAGFMLLGGRAADLFGHRRVLVAGLGLFAAASLVAGVAGAAQVLVAARVAQGIGAAMLAPATLAVINTGFAENRARAFGAWSAAGGVGGMAGAIVGGAMTTAFSWRSVFLINVPIGAALIAVALVSLDAGPRKRSELDVPVRSPARPDLPRRSTASCGPERLGHRRASPSCRAPLAFACRGERFATAPMLPLRLFGLRGVAAGSAMLLLFGGIAMAMWYFTSLFLQNVLHYALAAGLGQTPAAVLFVVVARAGAPRPASARCPGRVRVPGGGFRLALPGRRALPQRRARADAARRDRHRPGLPDADGVATADARQGTRASSAVANTAGQVGGAIALAVSATAAAARAGARSAPPALASGYGLVFGLAVGVALAIAAVSLLLPRHRPGLIAPGSGCVKRRHAGGGAASR